MALKLSKKKKRLKYKQYCRGLRDNDLGRMANLKLVDKRVKELVELKLQVLVEVRTSSGWWSKKEIMSFGFYF